LKYDVPIITGLGWLKLSTPKNFFNNDILLRWDYSYTYRRRKPSKKYSEIFGHTPLSLEEFHQYEYLVEGVDHIVIGSGFQNRMKVMKNLYEYLHQRIAEVTIVETPVAVARFNDLLLNDSKVLGLFHLTC